jgi:hypothetical protein
MSIPRLYVELPTGQFRLSLEDYDSKIRIEGTNPNSVAITVDADELWNGLEQLMRIRSRPETDDEFARKFATQYR